MTENGREAQGELVRLEVELARYAHPLRPVPPRFVELKSRVDEILRGTGPSGKFNVCEWTGMPVVGGMLSPAGRVVFGPDSTYGGPYLEVGFADGFATSVYAPIDLLRRHLPGLVRRHPVRAVTATDKVPFVMSEVEHDRFFGPPSRTGRPFGWVFPPMGYFGLFPEYKKAEIPSGVAARFRRGDLLTPMVWRFYLSPFDALLDLSDALLAEARGDPLPEEPLP